MKKKKVFSGIILGIVIIAGLSLMLYPTVSNYINSLGYHRVIDDYRDNVLKLSNEECEEMLAAARAYNAELAEGSGSLSTLSDERRKVYESLLDVNGNGVMGYITIPSINVSLPVYHGTDEATLQSGIGHMEGSSLPVGGVGTYTILTGHRGLPSVRLFTDIDSLSEKDTFSLHVLNEVLTYEIDNIETVLPEEVASIKIDKDKDYCMLMTCTPYGVNTHRLLVRGRRIETPGEDAAENESVFHDDIRTEWYMYLIIPYIVVLLITIVVIITLKHKSNKNN